MKQQILAGAVSLALAATMTNGAMAFDQGSADGRYLRSHHSRGYGEMQSLRARRDSRFGGIRGYESWRHGGWGASEAANRSGYIDLGPLGFTAACGSPAYGRGYCGQGYSVLAR